MPAPIAPVSMTERIFTLSAPCRGDSFNFEISVVGSWTGKISLPYMLQAIEGVEPEYQENIEKRLRQLSREFEADSFASAEQHMNEELAPALTYEMGLLSCRSRVRVGPDDELREHLRKQWSARTDYEAQHVLAKRHIEHLTELRGLWASFLQEVDGPFAVEAIRLANKPSFVGDVVSEVAERKQQNMDALREIVDKAIVDHERFDLYDFVTSYDSALRDLMRHLGMSTTSNNGAEPMAS